MKAPAARKQRERRPNLMEDDDTCDTVASDSSPYSLSGDESESRSDEVGNLVLKKCSFTSKDDFEKENKEKSCCNDSLWNQVYDSPPIVSCSMIVGAGFLLFGLALLWPPLILFVMYAASQFFSYAFRQNDEGEIRRKLFKEFCKHNRLLPDRFQNPQNYVNFKEKYWENGRGMLLCTAIMTPKDQPIKSVLCFCHGYTDSITYPKRVDLQRFVDAGVAIVMIEYEGHGRSDGPLALIPSWDTLTEDVTAFFKEAITTNSQLKDKTVFIMGESMGGAIAHSVYSRMPTFFRGVIFVSPMCKISDDMLPPQFVIEFIQWLVGPTGSSSWIGYLPITPSGTNKSIRDLMYRIKTEMTLLSCSVPTTFSCRRSRLTTSRELLAATQRISNSLVEFDAPFLILHGKEDRVTDPALSQMLYNESKSKDKSIKLYEGLWHSIISAESEQNMDMIYSDMINWISERS